jgi:transcription initiation factor IIF auxiliary subunit
MGKMGEKKLLHLLHLRQDYTNKITSNRKQKKDKLESTKTGRAIARDMHTRCFSENFGNVKTLLVRNAKAFSRPVSLAVACCLTELFGAFLGV